ncbi:spore germination protein GerPC [Desertibacillus haloalkaliphilus]|uniref:spore germination protein GerPC n=1 Tax=Desertibacillus haloalkaliphilus TaxID=1328930 RepID=UPI001C27B4D7|nr:spore germination protein GerPC [Desertibacillus haloalkaliphilus]MBU8907911.1 spore germination protein GerPC [Desertibacillus haloalkaliphilus]
MYQYCYGAPHTYGQHYENDMRRYEQRIADLERTVQQLQSEIHHLRQNQQPTNVEYKFDQLKVERLDGTLNIGLNPNQGEEAIDDFSVNQHQLQTPFARGNSDLFENVRKDIYHYLDHDCYPILETLEAQYNYPLEPSYRQFIIDDVKKQIDHRIQYYLNQVPPNQQSDAQLKDIEHMTKSKVKEDIQRTFESFITHLPRRESNHL